MELDKVRFFVFTGARIQQQHCRTEQRNGDETGTSIVLGDLKFWISLADVRRKRARLGEGGDL
jgi:hypothetical protein